ncbi:hypothetical protein Hanom_Chr02g00171811 [Helianthus anomalus]
MILRFKFPAPTQPLSNIIIIIFVLCIIEFHISNAQTAPRTDPSEVGFCLF